MTGAAIDDTAVQQAAGRLGFTVLVVSDAFGTRSTRYRGHDVGRARDHARRCLAMRDGNVRFYRIVGGRWQTGGLSA